MCSYLTNIYEYFIKEAVGKSIQAEKTGYHESTVL